MRLSDSTLSFFDKFGALHPGPDSRPDSSENSILFYATAWLLARELKIIINNMPIINFEEAKNHNKDSHDNTTGSVCMMQRKMIKREQNPWTLQEGRKWYHPRDICMYASNKFPFLSWLLMPVVDIANIYSCYTTWRENKNGRHLTTSGKMLALTRCLGFKRYKTLRVCTWLIKRNPYFGSWKDVSKIYFPQDAHPTVILCDLLDKELDKKWG